MTQRKKDTIEKEIDDAEPMTEKKISIRDDYHNRVNKIIPRGTLHSTTKIEVLRYMEECPAQININPLDWWRTHEHFNPNFARLVKDKCSMVATSVPCERICSKTGII